MADVKKNDWFATLLYNPDLSTRQLSELGITPENSGLKTKDEYKNIDDVKQEFSDANGHFDNKKFDDFYNGALELYNKYALDEYNKKIPQLFIDSKWDAPREAPILDATPNFDLKKNSALDPYGVYYMPSSIENINYTPKELAEMEEVVDYKTGESLGWTPEDKGGLFKGLIRPTIVLAAYDEDEYDDNGQLIHAAGDLKYNANGKPYAETLGDRDIRNKQIIAYSDTLTREKSNWNKVDFFDSDGWDKSFGSVLAKTAVSTIPYFIPGVNYVFGAITAAEQLMRFLPVLGKTINGIATDNSDNSFGRKMNELEGFWAKFDPTSSYKSQEKLVTFENFGNLVSSVSGQLFQQRVIGMIPYWLDGAKNSEEVAKIGRNLSYAYMAATSSQDAYNTFKDAGASDRVAGFATLANVLAIWKLMQIDYFRDNLFKGTYMDETEVRVPAMNMANNVRDKVGTFIEEAEQINSKKGAAKFINKLSDFYHKTMLTGIAKGGIPARMLSEATEEVMEEIAADLTKGVTTSLNWLGLNVTEEGKELDFNFSPQDVAQRYGMAFAGGFIGGGMFAGQGKFENWLLRRGTNATNPDDMKKLIYYIAQGKGQEMKDFYEKWHKKGLLGSRDLGTQFTTIETINGRQTVAEPTRDGLSQNDIVYKYLVNYIDYIEGLVNAEGVGFTKQQIDNLKAVGFAVTPETLKAQTLIDLEAYSTLEDDLWSLAVDIVKKNNEIQEKIDAIEPAGDNALSKESVESKINNNTEINRLKIELQNLRKKREDLLSGKLNYKYATQALFITNPSLSDKIIDISKENFARFKFGVPYSTMSDEQKKTVDEQYEEFKKGEGRDKILKAADLYYELASRWGGKIKEEANALIGFKVDSLHDNKNLGIIQYVNLLNETTKLEAGISELRSKENLTDDEKRSLEDKLKQLIKINTQVQAFQTAPGRLLANAHTDESKFKELNTLFTSTEFGEEQLIKIANVLRDMYQNIADNKVALSGDSELQALYNEIRKRYNLNPIEKRMLSYFNDIESIDSEKDINEGKPEGTYKEDRVNRVNTDTDEWFTDSADEPSNLKDDVLDNLQKFIDSFGINNTIAIQSYNNILNALRTRTNLSNDEINEFLNYVIPKLGNQNIVDFIKDIDLIRAKVKYSPIATILKDLYFDYSGTKSNIIELLEAEEKALSSSPLITDYLIQNNQVKADLNEAKNILDVLSAILIGSTDKTNASINAFESNPKELPVIERESAVILGNDIDILKNRINYLLDRDEANSKQALKQHERIDKNMRSKFLLSITNDAFVKDFESKFRYTDDEGEHKINLKTILDKYTPSNFSFESINLINPNILQDIWCKFEQELFNEVKKVSFYNNDQELAKQLLSLFDNSIWKMTSTNLSDKEDEVIRPADQLAWLMTIITVPSNAFYSTYKNITTTEDFRFAPVFGQEFAVRIATGMMARKSLFNEALKQIKTNANSEFESLRDSTKRLYLQNLGLLNNFILIPGGAGCGKSTGVAGTTASLFNEHASKQFVALAPKKIQAQRLVQQLGPGASYLTKDDFFNSIYAEKPGVYTLDNRTGHIVRSVHPNPTNSIFDNTKQVKVLVIDEIGLFTEAELEEITSWAESNDVFVLGLGDPTQNTAIANVKKSINNKPGGKGTYIKEEISNQETGLEDTIHFHSPMLTASLRNDVLAKKVNFETLYTILNNIWNKYSDNRTWGRDTLNGLVPKDIELKYYDGQGKFYGDKIVNNNVDALSEAKKFKQYNVALIYDNDKYSGLTEEGVKFLPFDNMQGDEYDYVVIDIDFSKHGNGAYAMLKNLYTTTQRARLGSIIKTDNLTSTLSFAPTTSDPIMNQQIGVSQEQIKLFKEYRRKALSTVSEDNTFYSNFKASPIKKPEPSPKVVKNTPKPTQPVSFTGSESPTPTGSNQQVNPPIIHRGLQVSTEGLHSWFTGKDFRTYESKNSKSVFNFAKKLDNKVDFRSKDYPNLYQDFIELISSVIRTSKNPIDSTSQIVKQLEDTIGQDLTNQLVSVLNSSPELYVIPYNNDTNLLVARYGDSIEVPVLPVKTKLVGKYTGKLKRVSEMKLKDRGNMQSLSTFLLNNPGVHIFSTAGVVSYNANDISEINSDSNLKDGAKAFLTRKNQNGKTNNGKLFVAMTDELSDVESFGNNIWMHPDDGNLLSYYNLISLMGIHKPLSISNVAAYVKAVQQGKSGEPLSGESLMQQGIWEDISNPVESLKSLDWASLPESGTSAFYSEIYKRKWQVTPLDRAFTLSRLLVNAAINNPKYDAILNDLTVFLNTIVEPSQNIKSERHVLVLTGNNGKFVYIVPSIVNNNIVSYNAYDYNLNTRNIIGKAKKLGTNYQGAIPINEWTQQLLDSSLSEIRLMREVVRVQDDAKQLVDLTPNDQLFLLLDSISRKPEILNALNDELLKTQDFQNAIYMDDTAEEFIAGSHFFRAFKGDYMNGYVTPIQTVQYSAYEINESEIVPSVNPITQQEQTIDNRKESINALVKQFNRLSKMNLTVNEDSIISDDIESELLNIYNNELKFRNGWISGKVVKDSNGKYNYLEVDDSVAFINDRATKKYGENSIIQIIDNSLNNAWKYAIFFVTLPDGSNQTSLMTEDAEIKKFNSYPSFKQVYDLYNFNQTLYKPLTDYIKGLLIGKGFSSKANNWLINTEEAKDMYMLINNHLNDRLSNEEC